MTDSKNTDDLDKYGVWVKKPPRTVDSENENLTDDGSESFSMPDITADLPDFSSLDDSISNDTAPKNASFDEGETSLSPEELSGITGSAELVDEKNSFAGAQETDTQEESMEKENNAASTEEIPLDEFITGGFSDEQQEAPSETTPESATPEPEQNKVDKLAEGDEESVSLDDFLDAEPEKEQEPKAISQTDDKPLDIDLSFDEPVAPVDAATTETKDSAPVLEEKKETVDGSENIDLSAFGFDTDTENSSNAQSSDSNTEEVDLSEFGVTNAEEAVPAVSSPAATAKVDYDMSVITDDETKTDKVNADNSTKTEKAQQSFTTPEDSDFDIDAIMSDVKDENGKTVCIGKAEDSLVKEVNEIPEENHEEADVPPEKIEDLTEQDIDSSDVNSTNGIPDTFDEETSSLIDDIAEDKNENNDNNKDEDVEQKSDDFSVKKANINETDNADKNSSAENESSSIQSSILHQIVGELDSLKNEIAGLKTDFESLKKRSETEISEQAQPQTENNGFFSNVGEDDTISLSGDELDNILNNADFTETHQPTSDTEVKNASEESKQVEQAADAEPEPDAELPEAELVSDDETSTEDLPDSELADTESENLFGDVDNTIDIPDQDFDTSDSLKMDFSNDNLEEPSLDDIDIGIKQSIADESISRDLPEEITVPKVDDILVDSSSTDLIEDEDKKTDAEKGTYQASKENEGSLEKLYEKEPSINETLTKDKIDYLSSDSKQNSDEEPADAEPVAEEAEENKTTSSIPGDLKQEIKSVLSYMDQLLENLPEEKITEFAQSEQFETYKKLFKELGLS